MRNVLFCNIAYMQYYDFANFKEKPKYGGQFVRDTGDAYEKFNFHRCDDGIVRGFVETKYIDGSASAQRPRQLRIENINADYKKADRIDNVTVVFCAHSDTLKQTVIVGWYQHATVYRARPKYQERQFNIECTVENARLLSETERTFIVPRASQADYGFGQSNVWFAKDASAIEFVESVFKYIESECGVTISADETLPQEVSEEYVESGIGKKVLVNRYERNPVARNRCLAVHGTKCMICGFDAETVYGADFTGKIEVHHIVPISKIDADYKVDPETDLIPVCPNCHTILHTKKPDGNYPTVNMLQSLFK